MEGFAAALLNKQLWKCNNKLNALAKKQKKIPPTNPSVLSSSRTLKQDFGYVTLELCSSPPPAKHKETLDSFAC